MTHTASSLIVGNWKMNGTSASAATLIGEILDGAAALPPSVALVICPPFTLLDRAGRMIEGSVVRLGAQDCRAEPKGAYTGDVAAPMLADLGVHYVILGHSERRRDHFETDAQIRAKAEAALACGLTPIICIGETAEERDAGDAFRRLSAQIAGAVPAEFGADAAGGVIAYEPVWAIGTGRTASREDIESTTAHIRQALAAHLGTDDNLPRILYGGSVTARDAASILSIGTVNGVLVGGASLSADSFLGIAAGAAGSPS
ncbi:triose-phosphate isomerase [Acidomonas methanolica]|uniref:triose-phosphate isomerase n=1 Tax=Acidomonas methanolica TaxID=437 RepID=UPI00211A52BE|nr:triose-phosphate isomerase [Acidomonas methanolica]MCQ9154381.1 triose-phosphate isomerase [Acidomonas methanolica]